MFIILLLFSSFYCEIKFEDFSFKILFVVNIYVKTHTLKRVIGTIF